jgi:hypothetical protein
VRQGHAPLNPRVHKVAAGMLASQFAGLETSDDGGICLSCGSNGNTRFLCRRGPYCRVLREEHPRSDGQVSGLRSGAQPEA